MYLTCRRPGLGKLPYRHHDAYMRTTVSINDALLRELRRQSVETGRPFREILEQTLAVGLAHSIKPRRPRRVKIQPHALGVKAGFQNVNLNQLYDQIEAEASCSG